MVKPSHLESVRGIGVGAAPLGQLDAEKLKLKAPHIIFLQAYGLTETSPAVSSHFMGAKEYGSIGSPIPQTEMKIVSVDDPNFIGLGHNQTGEILVRGPQVMEGYLNNEKATNETIIRDNWLRTGDMGYYNDDGFFYVTDRLKELIKVKGFQVAPAELEEILRDHPQVSDAGVVGVPDEKYGEIPRAFVVRKEKTNVSEQELQEFVASKVANYKQLKGGVKFLSAIPKTSTGKILRKSLKE